MLRLKFGRDVVPVCLTAISFVVALAGVARPALAQQQGQLYISALDSKGEPITDLMPNEITVQADDMECKILKLEPVSKPMKIALMIDNGPVNSNSLANLRTGIKSFIDAVPAGIPIELITIAPQPRFLEKCTTDHDVLNKAVDRITPDSGIGLFFDALVEAGNRIDKEKNKEKSDAANVIVMVASTLGRNSSAMDRDWTKFQKQIVQYAITVHFIVMNAGGESVGAVQGALQTQVGLAVTKLSRGRYENINSTTRLTTLLPEMAKQIAESNTRQTHQYKVTYQFPAGKEPQNVQKFSAGLSSLRVGAAGMLSLDGRMPVGGNQ